MDDNEVTIYLDKLYKKYAIGLKEDTGLVQVAHILDDIREKFADVRDIPMNFSNNEIHDLHVCISECISYHDEDKRHRKEHPNGCNYCDEYKKLWRRIVDKCDCIDKGSEL